MVESVNELAQIMKDLSVLVIDQVLIYFSSILSSKFYSMQIADEITLSVPIYFVSGYYHRSD